MNKTSGVDGIPVELFQILKDDAVKVLHLIGLQIWKSQQWPQDWKRSVFIPIPKKGNAKECSNYCAIALTCQQNNVQNSPSEASTVHEPRTRCSSWIQKRQKNQRSNCQHPLDHKKTNKQINKQKNSIKNMQFCFIDYAIAFDCVDHSKLWKILKEMGIPDHFTCLMRNLYVGQEATEPDMEQTGSKSGKEYVKAVYCRPAYLTYMQRAS